MAELIADVLTRNSKVRVAHPDLHNSRPREPDVAGRADSLSLNEEGPEYVCQKGIERVGVCTGCINVVPEYRFYPEPWPRLNWHLVNADEITVRLIHRLGD